MPGMMTFGRAELNAQVYKEYVLSGGENTSPARVQRNHTLRGASTNTLHGETPIRRAEGARKTIHLDIAISLHITVGRAF